MPPTARRAFFPAPALKRALLPLFLIALFLSSPARAEMSVTACFSPHGRCSSQILREIAEAKKEILAAVYALTSEELAWALVQARRRGLRVQVILDRSFDQESEHSKGSFLSRQQVAVRRVSGTARERGQAEDKGLMHQKFAVIDRSVVLTGSYNWTLSADRFNHENLLVFRNARPLAEEYRRQFLRLWEIKE